MAGPFRERYDPRREQRYGPVMLRPDRSHTLDHVVVIMFENRSFDNLLFRIVRPGKVKGPLPYWLRALITGELLSLT